MNTKTERKPAGQPGGPRFERSEHPLLLAGLRERFTTGTVSRIPALWQRFAPDIGRIPGQVGQVAYGVSFNPVKGTNRFDYLAAVQVTSFTGLPAKWSQVSVPSGQTFAIFPHHGLASAFSETAGAVLCGWLPKSGREPGGTAADAPSFFERYSEEFNPRTGLGGMELWLLLKD